MNALRIASRVALLLIAALMLSGCAESSSGDGGGEPSSAPTSNDEASNDESSAGEDLALQAAWLDEGRMVAVVTTGSSTCIPVADEIAADGQSVTLTLDEGDPNQPCTTDLVDRATLVGLPDGVDVTQDVELSVTLGSATGSVVLAGNAELTGVPGETPTFESSAGWYGDGKLALLTWGSSTCPPIIESIEGSGTAGTVTFAAQDGVCTMDMAPRASIVDFTGVAQVVPDGFVLTLVGDNLDGTVQVLA